MGIPIAMASGPSESRGVSRYQYVADAQGARMELIKTDTDF